MPVTKIPITHKFGIISQSQREDLQSRLLQKNFQKVTGPPPHQPVRNPLELSDEFILKFNAASDLDDKERLEDEARKLLARAKRRAGLKEGGKGNFVDLPKAWSELSMLAQCRGKVQEECLDALIISLHQASLSRAHIPCLFYLAETTLYWIRTDAMNQPFLRIGEIKLLKMGYVAFLCLFYHHMVGHLNSFGDLKDRLATYLSAIIEAYADSEEAYEPYPGSHLCLKFIVSVGKMITGEILSEHLGVTHQEQTTDSEYVPSAVEKTSDRTTPVSPPNSVLLDAMKQQKAEMQMEDAKETMAGHSPGYESSIHDLSPTLWHALDVWRCVDHLGEGFSDAMRALALCGSRLGTEHWVDSSCAIRVIGETAKGNLPVLRMFQNLAKGIIPQSKTVPINSGITADEGMDVEDDLASLESGESSKQSAASLDSMEIKFEEMMGIRTSSAVDGDEIKRLDPSVISPGRQKLSDTSYMSQQKSARNTSMCANLDTPWNDRAASLTSVSAMGTKPSPGSSSYRTVPDISSCESQLDSAGGMKRWSGSRLSDVRDVEDEDSDLVPGDDSFVEPRNVDVTKTTISESVSAKANNQNLLEGTEPKLNREVSFDIEIISNSPNNEPKRKSSLRGASRTGPIGANRSPSTKSVVIDPVPSTTFYSEGSDGASDKTDQPNIDLPTTKKVSSHYGIATWPWEVAYMYTEMLTNICLYGKTAHIKKISLIGSRNDVLNVTRPKGELMTFEDGRLSKLHSAGLLDLAEITKFVGNDSDHEDDWSWRVRFAAISGLVKISRSCQSDQSLEGMGTVVWNMLMIRHSQERDERVMEAFRVGQVDAQLECEMQKTLKSQSLNFRLAAGLASNYLPPLQPPIQPVKRKQRPKVELPKPAESLKKGPNRPSLRQELLLATALREPQVSLNSRTDLDLKRIVEDQWRKELQEEMEEEERKKQEELEKMQKDLEEEQKEVANRKKEKFNKSSVKDQGGG